VATTALSPALGAALTAFSDAFNQGLKDGLAGQPVQTIDIRRFVSDVVAHPTWHHMANVTVPACDAEKIARITNVPVTNVSALLCNATPNVGYNGLLQDADIDTWFFADQNHPTVGGYRLISDEVMRHLKSFGWLRGQDNEDLL
jgi:phospholipase/lecithinase/hemolysin